jgi:hypothetical protein
VRILAQLASVLPATLVVVLLSLRDGRLADPFLSSSELGTWTFLYIYVVLIYFLVNEALTRSSFHKAAWLFHSAAADPVWVHRRLRRSTRILVLWPYLLVLALFLYLHHGHPGHALLHALLLGVGAEAALPLLVATAPRFPFSESVQRSGARGRMVAGTLLLSACVGPVFTLVHHLCLRDPGRFAATLALLVLAGIGTNMAAARRMRRVLAEAEFAG